MAKRLEINTAWCKGCGICVEFCVKKILKLDNGKAALTDANTCIKCGICESLCPDFAIYIVNEEDQANG